MEEQCSFCSKSANEVPILIVGKSGSICGDCVSVCVEVIGKRCKKLKKEINCLLREIERREIGGTDG